MDSATEKKIIAMREGGHALALIRDGLVSYVKIGMTFAEIEAETQRQIKAAGMVPSFSTVPGYSWATCIMKNDGLCHGIPNQTRVEDGDILTIDLGLINKGYHLDTTTTFIVGTSTKEKEYFLEVGRRSLKKAIQKVRSGQSVYAVSEAMENVLAEEGMGIVYQLTGHGVGEELHMDPHSPCIALKEAKRVPSRPGQHIAVETKYTAGAPH